MDHRDNADELLAFKKSTFELDPVCDTTESLIDAWAHVYDVSKCLCLLLQVWLVIQHLKDELFSFVTLKFLQSFAQVKDAKLLDSWFECINLVLPRISGKESFKSIRAQLINVSMVYSLEEVRANLVAQDCCF